MKDEVRDVTEWWRLKRLKEGRFPETRPIVRIQPIKPFNKLNDTKGYLFK